MPKKSDPHAKCHDQHSVLSTPSTHRDTMLSRKISTSPCQNLRTDALLQGVLTPLSRLEFQSHNLRDCGPDRIAALSPYTRTPPQVAWREELPCTAMGPGPICHSLFLEETFEPAHSQKALQFKNRTDTVHTLMPWDGSPPPGVSATTPVSATCVHTPHQTMNCEQSVAALGSSDFEGFAPKCSKESPRVLQLSRPTVQMYMARSALAPPPPPMRSPASHLRVDTQDAAFLGTALSVRPSIQPDFTHEVTMQFVCDSNSRTKVFNTSIIGITECSDELSREVVNSESQVERGLTRRDIGASAPDHAALLMTHVIPCGVSKLRMLPPNEQGTITC